MLEFQITEGGTGDSWLIKGPSLEVRRKMYAVLWGKARINTFESILSNLAYRARQLEECNRISPVRGEVENMPGERNVDF
jgi:hypothetical protein